MSMISQGFPLWASNPDGFTYAVVGWDERGYPSLVPVGEPAGGAEGAATGQAYIFTTTDPTAQAFTAELVSEPSRIYGMTPQEVADTLARANNLRARMTRLADDLERAHGPGVGRAIRTELAK